MTRSVLEANTAISRIRELPYGIARNTAAAAELDRITAEGPPQARAYALFATVESYVWGGEVERAFLPFTQMLRWWDAHPEHFDPQDQHSLFWSFKWMVSHLMEFPAINAEQIDATLTDMQRRYALAGNGMNAVAMSHFQWARMRGTAEAENLFLEWTSTPRDDFSQCEACDPGDRAAYVYALGRHAECIRLIEQTLADQPECATEPGDMLSFLQLAYLFVGDAAGAARAHRAALQHLPDMSSSGSIRGRHLEFLARSGNASRALARLTQDQRLLTEGDTPYERWHFLRSVGAVTGLLSESHADAPISLHGVPAATIAELDRWARAEALSLARQFDARNGTPATTEATWAVWNDPTVLAVDLSVFGDSEPAGPRVSGAGDPQAGGTPGQQQTNGTVSVGEAAAQEASSPGSSPDDPAALIADAEAHAATDPIRAARTYVAAADAYRLAGRLEAAGFAHAEAAMLASAQGDDDAACTQFSTAVSLLRGAATPARFIAPVVQAWARRCDADQLPQIDQLAETLLAELARTELSDQLSEDVAEREQGALAAQERRLRDTRARIAATLGDPSAAASAEEVAEEFARAGEYSDAAHAFWLLGTLRPDGSDAVYALESAMEGFALAHHQGPRRLVGNELVGMLQRLGRDEEANELAVALSTNS